MTKQTPPPLFEPIAGDDGLVSLPWVLHFNQGYLGDTGTDWTPVFTSLTSVGTPTITGRYFKLSQTLSYFRIKITPATNTSATAGTTYCDNFPLNFTQDGFTIAVTTNTLFGGGSIDATAQRIYTPSWTTITSPVTILGVVEAR